MNPDVIRTWLKLPPGPWPPDHYQLLGLAPGESNLATIERHVQSRMDLVRRYQVRHPEQATEAMNRLAQAFVSLTDPAIKHAYDRSLNLLPPEPVVAQPQPAPVPEVEPESRTEEASVTEEAPAAELAGESLDPLAWLYAPAAVLVPEPAVPPGITEPTPLPEPVAEPVVEIPLPPPLPVPVEPPPPIPVSRLTSRDLYRQLRRLRRVQSLWNDAGKYLASPKKRIARPTEAKELTDALAGLHGEKANLPGGMGEVGQPGYFVLVLAAQQNLLPTFLTLTMAQRKKLAADWADGTKRLTEEHEELRERAHSVRQRPTVGRRLRRALAMFKRQSAMVLLLLGFLVLNVILWRSLVAVWRGTG